MSKDTYRRCDLCSTTIKWGSSSGNNDCKGDSQASLIVLCEYCQNIKRQMGNLSFAIMHGLSREDGNIRSIIERSSADWLVSKGRAKSSPAVENAQTDFFESVPEPEIPRQAPVNPDEVENIVRRALPTAHEVDSMKNLFVFVRRKGIEA